MSAGNNQTQPQPTAFLRAKQLNRSLFAMRRPWCELFSHPVSFSIPHSFNELSSRLNRNLNHFRVNYAIIVLLILFVSLLYPVCLPVFIFVFAFWFLFYFSREEPVVLFGRLLDDRLVLLVLAVVTVVGLVFTRVWFNVLVSVLVGVVFVGLHAMFRLTDRRTCLWTRMTLFRTSFYSFSRFSVFF